MTNEEAKVFLNNLKICIDEHPVVADWLVEIANRKVEPNNCESECCKCRWWNFEFGCQSKYKCKFEPYRKESE